MAWQLAVLLGLVATASAQPQCLCLEEVTSMRNSGNPLVFRYSSTTDTRRFIGEQVGLVWIVQPDGTRLAEPFMDLREFVLTSDFPGDERGFLQLEFHPQFASNGKLYVWFSREEGLDEYTSLAEFTLQQGNPNRVNISSGRILMNIVQPFPNHNGGDILFGRDNLLYIFTGDGGAGGDPLNYSQDKTSLLGKVLRIDVNRRDEGLEYGIPPDNPYLNDPDEPDARRELYSIGLRNPWRVAYDRDYTGSDPVDPMGRMIISDVGQNAWEEFGVMRRGPANYEWPCMEGKSVYDLGRCLGISNNAPPNHDYEHVEDTGGRSITAGYVYRGVQNRPSWTGLYFFSDYETGQVWYADGTQRWDDPNWRVTEVFGCSAPNNPNSSSVCEDNGLSGNWFPHKWFLSFGEDNNKEQYLLSTDEPSPTNQGGRVWKLRDPAIL